MALRSRRAGLLIGLALCLWGGLSGVTLAHAPEARSKEARSKAPLASAGTSDPAPGCEAAVTTTRRCGAVAWGLAQTDDCARGGPAADATRLAALPTPTRTPTPRPTRRPATPTPVRTPTPAWQYTPDGLVTFTSNRGLTRILGTIRDAAGNPVDGVLVQCCTNQCWTSKPSGSCDPGCYDFTLGDWSRNCKWLVTIIDQEGHALSPTVLVETTDVGWMSIATLNWRKHW